MYFFRKVDTQEDAIGFRLHVSYATEVNARHIYEKCGAMVVDRHGNVKNRHSVLNGQLLHSNGVWYVRFADQYMLVQVPVHVKAYDVMGIELEVNSEYDKDFVVDINPGIATTLKYGDVAVIEYGFMRMTKATIGKARGTELDESAPHIVLHHNSFCAPDYDKVIPNSTEYEYTFSINAQVLLALCKMAGTGTLHFHLNSNNTYESAICVEVTEMPRNDLGTTKFVVMPVIRSK